MATLSLNQVKKVYPNGYQAIQALSLEIEDGEFVVIVGPSGCGKSTLLRMIAGLENITDGDLHIANDMVNNKEPADRDIAMVFQNYALYPHMNVYKNMAYGLKNRGVNKAEIDEKVRRAAETLELTPLLERKPRELSGGQRQRVAMGRAIVRDPKAFLFDEPLSNLDAKLRVQMRNEIKSLQRSLGTTSIYVTHDQVEAMTLADRLLVMNKGVVEQVGSPMEIYEKPQSMFVAGFIGSPSMNFVEGDVADGVLRIGNASWTLPKGVEQQGRVVMGIRPEHLYRSDAYDCALSFQIELIEPLGADTLIHGYLDGSDQRITARLSRAYRESDPKTITLHFTMQEVHLFDPETEQRIDF